MWKCPKCGRKFSRKDQSHYCIKPNTVDEYIQAQNESVRPALEQIRTAVRSAVPDAEERISWSMPAYWKGTNLISFAAARRHIGIYPGEEAAAAFAEELSGFDVDKGTIRIRYDQDLPLDLIARIARWCYDNYKG